MLLNDPLVGKRITVRNYRKEDLPFVGTMWFDEANGRYMSDPTEPYIDEKYQAALDALEDNPEGYYLTVILNGSEKIVGTSCIFPNETEGSFDIGYCIHKDFWKQGFGSELLELVIDWIHSHGGNEITAEVAKDNAASNRLLLKHGFKVIRETEFKKYNMGITFPSNIYRLAPVH